MLRVMQVDLRTMIATTIVRSCENLRWTQRRLAAEADVSQTAAAKAWTGQGGSVEVLQRLLAAIDARVSITPGELIGGLTGQDIIHRTCVRTLRRILERAGLRTAVEVPVVDGSQRGFIDLLAFDDAIGRLIVIEFKSELRDHGAIQRQLERYARSCIEPARTLGWRPKEILVVLVALATDEADAFVAANRVELARTLPARGKSAIESILDHGPIAGRALLAMDPARPGRAALTSFRVDGRRRPFRLAHAWELRRELDERDAHEALERRKRRCSAGQ